MPTPISRHALLRPAPTSLLSGAAIVALLVTTAIFLLYFAVYVVYARGLFQFPFDYDQGEGFELFDGIRLARGQNIYLDNAIYPFYASNYPPVYRLLLVPLIWIFGPKLVVARLLTWVMSLGIGLVIFAAVRDAWNRRDSDRPGRAIGLAGLAIAGICGLSFFAANYVYQIGPLARAHLPMVMFGMAGVLCLERAFAASRLARGWVLAGVALLLVAGFTKLQAVDALAAGFGFLLLHRPRWGVAALLVSAAVSGAVVLALNLATGGQFWLNVVAANVNEYSLDRTWEIYAEFWRLQAPLILCGVAHVALDIGTAIRKRSTEPISIWSLYFLGGIALGMLTGKWGAGPVYLIASIGAGAVCAGRLAARAAAGMATRIGGGPGLALTALAFSGLFIWQAGLNIHLPTSGRLFGALARVLGAEARSSYPPFAYYD
ncbi:MAG: hypothetical protein ABIQ99_01690, partial [Thermoflexales bacterium]